MSQWDDDPWASNPYGIHDWSWMEQPEWWPQKLADFRAMVLEKGGPELVADPDEAWPQFFNWAVNQPESPDEKAKRKKTQAMIERMGRVHGEEMTRFAIECLTEAK